MGEQIISIDCIKRHARAAADAGKDVSACPYHLGTPAAKRWYAEYLMREVELHDEVAA